MKIFNVPKLYEDECWENDFFMHKSFFLFTHFFEFYNKKNEKPPWGDLVNWREDQEEMFVDTSFLRNLFQAALEKC